MAAYNPRIENELHIASRVVLDPGRLACNEIINN
jgi:hypothetical protein